MIELEPVRGSEDPIDLDPMSANPHFTGDEIFRRNWQLWAPEQRRAFVEQNAAGEGVFVQGGVDYDSPVPPAFGRVPWNPLAPTDPAGGPGRFDGPGFVDGRPIYPRTGLLGALRDILRRIVEAVAGIIQRLLDLLGWGGRALLWLLLLVAMGIGAWLLIRQRRRAA